MNGDPIKPLVIRAAVTVTVVLGILLVLRCTGVLAQAENIPVQMLESLFQTI